MSSLGGSRSNGNFSRSLVTVAIVSSTLSVVCDNQARFVASSNSSASTSSGDSTKVMCSGASPAVPSTSSWPLCPISRICLSSLANRLASMCTLVTSGHVASMVRNPRSVASVLTAGDTPWAENTTSEPVGTSSSSSTKTAPRCSRVSTTCLLWTICLRT